MSNHYFTQKKKRGKVLNLMKCADKTEFLWVNKETFASIASNSKFKEQVMYDNTSTSFLEQPISKIKRSLRLSISPHWKIKSTVWNRA